MRCYPKSTLALYASSPDHTLPSLARSLSNNALCGVSTDAIGRPTGGTYTAVGITALCEGLKGSAVTSLA